MQIIVFRLRDIYFGISTEYIEEITSAIPTTVVPKSPTWIEGLVNLRGDVLTLVNMGNLLNIDDKNKEDCYNNTIVAQLRENKIALMVNEVIGVSDVDPDDFHITSEIDQTYIQSLVSVYDKIVNILDLQSLFEEKEG